MNYFLTNLIIYYAAILCFILTFGSARIKQKIVNAKVDFQIVKASHTPDITPAAKFLIKLSSKLGKGLIAVGEFLKL